jgi:hypothetical protein
VRHLVRMYFRNDSDGPAMTCPECGSRIEGDLAGLMATHWRENHTDVMPWHLAWPLLRDGVYVPYPYAKPKQRRTGFMPRLATRLRHAIG